MASPNGPEGNVGIRPGIHQRIIDVSPGEGLAALLIDQRTGQRTRLLGYPTVSPGGRHLISVCEDVTRGAGVTNVTLYRHIIIAQVHPSADDDVMAAIQLLLTYIELTLP